MGTPLSPRADRIAVLLTSRAILVDGSQHGSVCFLHNLSNEGACLSFPSGAEIPAHFDVLLEQGSQAYPVEVRWLNGDKAGVQFVEAPSAEARRHLLSYLTPAAGQRDEGLPPGL
ncbi:PilZ domain-containing protein [Methylobacterium sp. ID0610]|uniref:PilZ domain-containing protein n=1 Tax=Methylobacterium carpenticola TaxID=3344827 RepID=UPI0036B5633D